MKNKTIAVVVIFFSLIFVLSAQSEGKKLFLMNEPEKAIPLLEQEIEGTVSDPSIYNCLGIAYYQIGEYNKSVDIFEKALNVDGTDKKIIAFNAGNSAYAAENYDKAQQYYSLAIAADSTFSKPVLNRANCYLKQGNLQNSLSDYENFLFIAPNDKQHDKVEKLVTLLKTEIQNKKEAAVKQKEEAARIKQEEKKMAAAKAEQEAVAKAKAQKEAEAIAKAKAEQEAVAKAKAEQEAAAVAKAKAEQEAAAAAKAQAEQKAAEVAAAKAAQEKAAAAAAEAARRRKLLEEAAAALQESDTTNMTAGPESVEPQEEELDLD